MEKNTSGLLVVLVVFGLLIGGIAGGLVGYNSAPVETKTVTQVEYQNVSVKGDIEYVSLPSKLDLAVEEFMNAVDDEEDESGEPISILEDTGYDFDEIKQYKVYDEYSVDYDGDKTTVEFSIRLKFDEDDEKSEKKTYDVTVYFEEDEDTEILVA